MKQLLILFIILWTIVLPAQRINTSFGKNRVQFHKDYEEWRKYQSDHFTSYWYGRARNIANDAVNIAEEEYEQIRQLMEYRLNDKIELLIFTDLTDLKQSNIGSSDIFVGKAGESTVVGNKIFLYFDGNHKQLYKSIRSGIAEVFLNQMYIGSSLKELIKNRFVLDVPNWFKRGLISYVGERWNSNIESKFNAIVSDMEEKDWNFYNLASEYPNEIGHSFWYFIDQNYGRSTISNILYLTRIYKNSNEAFLFELGQDLDIVLVDWKSYYINNLHQQLPVDNRKEKEYIFKSKKDEKITSLVLSPDNKSIAYVKNHHGKYKLMWQDLKTRDTKVLFKYGYRNLLQETDYNYPMVSWDNDHSISFIYEKRDVIYLRKINLDNGEIQVQELPKVMQRIYSLSTINEVEYLVTASKDGNGALFIYNAKKRQFKAITDDKYDYLSAEYIDDGMIKGVLFSSSRATKRKAVVEENNWFFNIYFMDFTLEERSIIKIDDFTNANQSKPKYLGNGKVGYLSDYAGYKQQHIYDFTTKESKLISDPSCVALDYDIDYSKNRNIYVKEINNRNYIYDESNDWIAEKRVMSHFRKRQLTQKPIEIPKEVIIPKDYQFITRFKKPKKIKQSENVIYTDKKSQKHNFNIDRITGARLAFRLDDYSFDYSNDILFEGLETYIEDQNSTPFLSNGGFLIKANTKDLFENYNIEAGLRVPARMDGNEVYMVVQDDKRLIDREYILYRKSKRFTLDEGGYASVQRTRKVSILGMARWKYPFDVYRSLRLSTSYHNENYGYLSLDEKHYYDPIVNDKRLSLKLEYIFDNTINKEINVLHGTRYKFYTEAINKFDLQIFDNPSLDLSTGHSFVLGMDARNYLPLGNHAVLASRIAAFTSAGSEKILYQLGGVENWLNPGFSANNTDVADQRFAYRYNVANLRGFKNNVRSGNSAVLSSIELRVSPFKYFTKKKIRSSFFRNFQLNFFYDIGTAWYGLSPFDDNPLNQVHISQPPIFEIDITYYRDPIVMGYGLGFRSTILGTLIRVDYGWGLESGIIQKPILYLGLGKDF